MFLRHALGAHLDDGVELPAHVPDRVDLALVLHRAGHLAVRPPHERDEAAGLLDLTAPDAQVGFDVERGAGNRQDGLVVQCHRELGSIDAGRRPSVAGQGILQHRRGWSRHDLNAGCGLGGVGKVDKGLLLAGDVEIGRGRPENMVKSRSELRHQQPLFGGRLFHLLELVFRQRPFLAFRQRQRIARERRGGAFDQIEEATHRQAFLRRVGLRDDHLDAVVLCLSEASSWKQPDQ